MHPQNLSLKSQRIYLLT